MSIQGKKKSKLVSLRLTKEAERHLSVLEKMLGLNQTDLILHALEQLYSQKARPELNYFESFNKAGLIGCLDADDTELSTNYKETISSHISKKL